MDNDDLHTYWAYGGKVAKLPNGKYEGFFEWCIRVDSYAQIAEKEVCKFILKMMRDN